MRELRGMAAKMDMGRTIKALSDPAVKDVRKLVEGLASVPVGEQRDTLAELLVARFAKDGGGRLRLSEQIDLGRTGRVMTATWIKITAWVCSFSPASATTSIRLRF
ncbi:MAG: hypothetical protein K2Y25_15895 [Pseudomonadaceae bacterium]|nr:hypothetical protein [Pseudomonadaceae bacterium]